MAITRVTNTRNGASAIRYAFEEPSHKKGMDRVLAASGSNLDTNFAMQQMKATWKSHGKDNGKAVQMYRIIQSFGLDELDPNNPEDIEKANMIGLEFASEVYPDRQSLIVTQADGEGGKLHNHILVNSVGFADGKSLRGKATNWSYISDKSDEIIQRHGLEPLEKDKSKDKETMAELKLRSKGEYVWKDDLKARIESNLDNLGVMSKESFKDSMESDYEVSVKYRGKGLSYSFLDDEGKQRRIRASRLGSDYELEALEERFKANLEEQEIPQEKTEVLQDESQSNQDIEESVLQEEKVLFFDIDAELENLRGKKSSKDKPTIDSSVIEKVRQEMELEKIERLHEDALIENAHHDALIDNQEVDAQKEKELEDQARIRAEKEKERMEKKKELEEKQRLQRELEAQRELERQEELRRERLRQRIEGVAPYNHADITDEFIDRFDEVSQELEGKINISKPYNDLDFYHITDRRLKEEARQEGEQQEVVKDFDGLEDGQNLEL